MEKQLAQLQRDIGHQFKDQQLLLQALTHRSYTNEHPNTAHNERLEFLGDAVLELLVSQSLYLCCAEDREGALSRRRAMLVKTGSLARCARNLKAGDLMQLGRGEVASGGKDKSSLLADVFEALVGAAFLDGGLETARKVVDTVLGDEIVRVSEGEAPRDYKSELQEVFQSRGEPPPEYTVESEQGPDHAKRYVMRVQADISGRPSSTGEGSTKKRAEQQAARALLSRMTRKPTES